MLGQVTGRDAFHKCATSKTDTRHTEFAKVPCVLQPNTALQSSLRKVLTTAGRFTVSRKVPGQCAAPRHTTAQSISTRTAVPIRRNVSSSLKATTHTDNTRSFQLVFQGSSPTTRVDASTPIAKCDDPHEPQRAKQHRASTRTRTGFSIPRPMFPRECSFTGQVFFVLRDNPVARPA